MKSALLTGVALLALCGCLGLGACHIDRDTAGRPEVERDAKPGSTAGTHEGTGDPKVGAGAGQVGTDAPPRSNATEQPNGSGERGDATAGKPDVRQ